MTDASPIVEEKKILEPLLTINQQPFEPRADTKYKFNYARLMKKVVTGKAPEVPVMRQLCQEDLWFVVYFVMRIPCANHPFWVEACKEIEAGPKDGTLDIWARGHGKSSIITMGETIQIVLNNPELSHVILSYSKSAALSFLRSIKLVFETSQFLKDYFPEIFYQNPEQEAPKWSEEGGLWVKRKSTAKEGTIEAYGLIEGMPTGRHYDRMKYDDVSTMDLVNTPELMSKVIESFTMSRFIQAQGGSHRIVGTIYHHQDLLCHLKSLTRPDGSPVYHLRSKPGTQDGTFNSPSVFLSQEELDSYKGNRRIFATQILCKPQVEGEESLDASLVRYVSRTALPKRIWKFLLIDPAGDGEKRQSGQRADDWACLVWAVEPYRDDLGLSNIYLLDGVVSPMTWDRAGTEIVNLYMRNEPIAKVGVEKTAMSAAQIHVVNCLRAKGKFLDVEAGTLALLYPGRTKKAQRIESALATPLTNGKVFVVDSCPKGVVERFLEEVERFPYWRDDVLDASAYIYEIIKGYRFPAMPKGAEPKVVDVWQRAKLGQKNFKRNGWLYV